MDEKRKTFINCLVDEFYDAAVLYTRLNNSPAPIPIYANLNTRDSHVVVFIGRFPNINITELAARFAVTKGAMSKTITRLSAQNFLEKTVADESGREVKVILTPKGQEVYNTHEARTVANRQKMYEKFRHLSLSQLGAAALFLEEMHDLLRDYSTFLDPEEPEPQETEAPDHGSNGRGRPETTRAPTGRVG
ncbi:MAG: MarR family transcriptional regulator [Deltaproteobacteria bacterium]|jgi:DNA-binding MarR family transcriptional regulator|nr:MarR family transcriptional regulator [Deltaproteobacteria bacterium]